MIVGPDYDAVHKRLLAIEKKLDRMESNPAPTVPQYDLEVPPPVPPVVFGYLNIPGPLDVDDYTVSLYYMFASPITDVWVRYTLRNDIENPLSSQSYLVAGFTEWVNDQAYYGDWWLTGGISPTNETTSAVPVPILWNMSGSILSDLDFNGPPWDRGAGLEVYDTRIQSLGTSVVAGRNHGAFHTEIWHNDVMKKSRDYDTMSDVGKPAFSSCQAVVIFNRYGDSGAANIDDISAGTTRGASDIMPIQNFDDGTFGDFVLDLGDMGSMTDSFAVLPEP